MPIPPTSPPDFTVTDANISFATIFGYSWHPFGFFQFSVEWNGTISAAANGTYAFQLNSDDGSWLFIDSALIVNDGGAHGPLIVTGTVTLSQGLHQITVFFFECCGGASGVDLSWKPPGATSFTLVPSSAFSSSILSVDDGDGIPSSVELSPAYQALGADPCRKTIAVQIDYMVASDHTHKPLQAAIDKVKAAFDAAPVPATIPCPFAGFPKKPSGINLIVDVKNAIPEQAALNFTGTSPETFDTIKAKNFDPARAPYFHYSLWVHDLAPGSSVSGIGELGGANFIVSLGEWTNHTGSIDEQAGTFMHELGHNLGLDHGGIDSVNFKPNYLSVMTYAFQTVGITSLLPNGTLTHRFDYSRAALPSLNEAALNETVGIKAGNDYTSWICPRIAGQLPQNRSGLGNLPIDWTCSGAINIKSLVSADVNGDGSLETLVGFNDWANLAYQFTNSSNFIHGGHITLPKGKEINFQQAKVIETYWKEFSSLKLTQFFTDTSLNPLKLDSAGNPSVHVVISKGIVVSTNPGQIIASVNMTNTAGPPVNSLSLSETLPVDWKVDPPFPASSGSIKVLFVFSNGTAFNISDQTTITVTAGNPATVSLSIANITATRARTALSHGQTIQISVQLTYALIGTSQPATSYPRTYTDFATATTFSRPLFAGTSVSTSRSAIFTAFAKS